MLTVREEHHVESDVDSAVAKWTFAEDVFEAAKWRIARDPDCGTPVSQTNAHPPRRVVYMRPIKQAGSPGLLVRYYQLETIVVIEWVHFFPPDDEPSDIPDAYHVT